MIKGFVVTFREPEDRSLGAVDLCDDLWEQWINIPIHVVPQPHLPQGQCDFNSPDILKHCEMVMGTIFYILDSGTQFLYTGSVMGRNFILFLTGVEK